MAGSFDMYVKDNKYTVNPTGYVPQANLTQTADLNKLANPAQMNNVNMQQYYDPTKLQQDMYKGIQATVNQERELAQDRLNNTMANAGLFRSGLTLQNQQQLERSALDALAKGWAETAYNVAQLQNDYAKAQAALDLDVSKYNTDIQNAFKTKNYDYLMNAAAQDQEAINKAAQFNIQIQNAYDEMAFKWMASLLDKEIREYQATMDALAREVQATLQYGDAAAKQKLANLNLGTTYYNKLFG